MSNPMSVKHTPRRVLIADDEAINRVGLRFLLEDVPNVQVIGEVANGKEALSFITSVQTDVVLMDVHMPVLNGIDATREILKLAPDVKILMLTSRNTESDLSSALSAGASGYCLKDSSPEEFVAALKVVCKGNTYLDAKVMPQLIGALNTKQPDEEKTQDYQSLSDDEIDLLTLRMEGLQEEKIADQFNVSLSALRVMEDNVRRKIGAIESAASLHKSGEVVGKVCKLCDTIYGEDVTFCRHDGGELHLETLTNRIGSTLGGKYKILEYVGRGGGASVYKARHRYLNQTVAVKIIHSEYATDFTMLQRFKREAEVLGRLEHPNVVKINDFGLSEAGTPYLVMEYLEGASLATIIKAHGKLDIFDLIDVFFQVCSALQYAHGNGLVHRDIKPSNIFLTQGSLAGPGVKLVDFGLAKAFAGDFNGQLTKYGQIVGTPSYISPEVCRGAGDSIASDIYSLGCSMFESATGALPFVGQSAIETMCKHVNDEIPELYFDGMHTEARMRLSAIIKRCMQKNPASRYESVSHLQNDLAIVNSLLAKECSQTGH